MWKNHVAAWYKDIHNEGEKFYYQFVIRNSWISDLSDPGPFNTSARLKQPYARIVNTFSTFCQYTITDIRVIITPLVLRYYTYP